MHRYFRESWRAIPTRPSSWSRKRAPTWYSRAAEPPSAAAQRQSQHEQEQAPVEQAEGLARLRRTQFGGERHGAEQFPLDHQRRAFTLERRDDHHFFAVGTVDFHAAASSLPRGYVSS